MNVLAFDPDSRTPGICFYDGGTYTVASASHTRDKDAAFRIDYLFREVVWMVGDARLDLVVVEQPEIWVHGKSAHKNIVELSKWAGICAGVASHLCGNIKFISPKDWKGQRPKLVHQKWVCDTLGWSYSERAGYVSVNRPHPANLKVGDPFDLGFGWWKHALDAVGIALWAKNNL